MLAPTIVFFILSVSLAVFSLFRFLRHPPSLFFGVVVGIAIYIPISITSLLPIDLLSSNDKTNGKNLFYLNEKYILFFWKFNYWSAFILMWALLPFLQEYYRSGEFTQVNKIKDSIKRNIKFYLIVGAIGIIGLIYYFIKFGFHLQTFKSLLIAFSHIYSLVLSLWLMSHGLINIPRRRWLNNINLENQLDNLYAELPKHYEELNESTFNFKDISSTISALERINGIKESVFKNELMVLLAALPNDLEFRNHIRSVEYTSLQQISHSTLSKLNSTLKNEETNYRSSLFDYNKAKLNILKLQDIIDSKPNKFLKFKHSSSFFKNGVLNFYLNVYLLPFINLLFASFLFILSLIIIESELLHSTKFSIINILLVSDKISSTGKFLMSFILVSYMSLSALISLTRIKIFRIYHLFPKHSSPVSVVFFTMYANRLTIPLSYNFLTLLKSGEIHSQFNDFLGKSINLSVLGNFINEMLPRLIFIPILLTSFNIFDKIKKKFTFDYFDGLESDNELDDNDSNKRQILIKEGKLIIQRATKNPVSANINPTLFSSGVQDEQFIQDEDDQVVPSIGSNFFQNVIGKFIGRNNNDDLRIPDYDNEV